MEHALGAARPSLCIDVHAADAVYADASVQSPASASVVTASVATTAWGDDFFKKWDPFKKIAFLEGSL